MLGVDKICWKIANLLKRIDLRAESTDGEETP